MINDIVIMVSQVLEGGAAFAHEIDTGASAYIPKAVVAATRLQEGDIVNARVKENIVKADDVPWFVISIKRRSEAESEDFADLEDVFEEIDDMGMVTEAEIMLALGEDAGRVHRACRNLYLQKRVIKLIAYSGPNSGPVETFYAVSLDALKIEE